MHEIKCPHCGEKFNLDETGYADIVMLVRDEARISSRLHPRRTRRSSG